MTRKPQNDNWTPEEEEKAELGEWEFVARIVLGVALAALGILGALIYFLYRAVLR